MTTSQKSTAGRRRTKKLTLKTETIRDLDARGKGKHIKGGDGLAAGQRNYSPAGIVKEGGTGFTYCGQVTCATAGCPLA